MLFSLITSRSNQGLYTILHDFLQIVVDNVDIVVSGCPISSPCQLLRYPDLLCPNSTSTATSPTNNLVWNHNYTSLTHISIPRSDFQDYWSWQYQELRIIFFDLLLLLLTRNQLVDTLKMEDCSVTKYYISVFFTLKMIIPQDSLSYFVSSKYSGFFIFVCTSS